MSYILEALKKAQAERQLGDAPTIHAPQAAQAAPAGATARKPLLLGLGAGALVVAAGALLFWRAGPASAPAPATTPAPAAAVAPAAPVAKAPAASPTLDVSAPPAPPAAPPAAPSAPPPAAPVAAPAAPATARTPATAPPVSPAPRAPAPAAAPEDSLPFLQQLPEPLRSEVPRPAFGGYMYSANPADRLLIVDKVLRREGEEVAPGLVLEKLLPKTAVMNYRGTRYRVPY
jgi:general secretion pathway protein B